MPEGGVHLGGMGLASKWLMLNAKLCCMVWYGMVWYGMACMVHAEYDEYHARSERILPHGGTMARGVFFC